MFLHWEKPFFSKTNCLNLAKHSPMRTLSFAKPGSSRSRSRVEIEVEEEIGVEVEVEIEVGLEVVEVEVQVEK